jgi:hypothetical protein
MPKLTLTYWVAAVKDGHPADSLRERTRKALRDRLEEEYGLTGWTDAFEAPRKVTVEYRDAFDLMERSFAAVDERIPWEAPEPRPDRFGWGPGDLTYIVMPEAGDETHEPG